MELLTFIPGSSLKWRAPCRESHILNGFKVQWSMFGLLRCVFCFATCYSSVITLPPARQARAKTSLHRIVVILVLPITTVTIISILIIVTFIIK